MYLKYCVRSYLSHAYKNKLNVLLRSNYSNLAGTQKEHSLDRYQVHVLPALEDNYMYVLTDKLLKFGIAIDPVEPDKVLKTIDAQKVELKAVLTTHHHLDHAGGNKLISEMMKNLPIYGGDERIESLTKKVSHDQIVKFGDLVIKCLHTPCHTSGHMCYFIQDTNSRPICFTGDTLFISGCGRFFEGTANDMLKSLNILSALPSDTVFYCGHEYTINNLKFALSIEPDNTAAVEKLRVVEQKLKRNEPSVPSTIGEELSYNPFLRVGNKSVQQHTKETGPVAVMTALRKLKDSF